MNIPSAPEITLNVCRQIAKLQLYLQLSSLQLIGKQRDGFFRVKTAKAAD